MSAPDLTNKALAKLFSVDFLIILIAGAFAIGVTYTTLAQGIEKNAKTDAQIQHRLEQIERDVGNLRINEARAAAERGSIINNQERILNALEKQTSAAEQYGEMWERRLRELERGK